MPKKKKDENGRVIMDNLITIPEYKRKFGGGTKKTLYNQHRTGKFGDAAIVVQGTELIDLDKLKN